MRRPVVVGVALGLVAVVVAWWLLFFSPKGDELNDTKDEVATAERTEQQLRADLARLQELDAERPAQEAKLAQFAALVPPTPDLASFILSANQIAAEAGVDWLSVNPAPPSPSPGAPSVINLSMQIEGGFFQLLDYLNRLEDLDRLVVVDSLAINAQEQTSSPSPTLSVTLSGRMFTRATVTPAGGVTTTTTTAPGTPATAPTSTVEPIGEGS